MSSARRIFIAGNGPSLREVDFDDLKGIDWLGMNAAYRHWDKIGVYPTIYSCLDKVVVRSHASEILRLHTEHKVDKFFLVKDILEELPDFPQDERVFFLEDMVVSTAPGSEIFKTAFSDKKTTGSWAVRFAIFLGYREIYMSGIDASYVEVIGEAERTGVGLELKIGAEVTQNPNYFFNDYQKPGDLYQIPNPERHYGNLHLQSFEAMNVDIARLGLGVVIRNTARGSQLNRFGVYEYVPLKEALRSPSLQAVAIPLTMRECDQFIHNLKLWDSPAFHPLRLDSPLIGRIMLHVFFDGGPNEGVVAAIEGAWNGTTRLKHMFAGLEITFLTIPEKLNTYIRNKDRIDVPRKMGPNVHFLSMMRKCRKYRYTQLLETDCVPAKSDWLTDLNSACVRQGPFWIAGAYLDSMGTVNRGLALQINGNAIYATGDPAFVAFLSEVFEPALRYLVLEKRDFSLAYDCLISRLMTYALASSLPRSGVKIDPRLEEYVHAIQADLDMFRFVRLYRNISHIDDQFSEGELLATLDSDCVIVHSRRLSIMVTDAFEALGRGMDRDVGSRVLQRRLKDTFIKVDPDDIYAFHYYSNLDGCTFDVFDRTIGVVQLSVQQEALEDTDQNKGAYVNFTLTRPSEGRTVRCEVELIGEAEQTALLRFARNGAGKYVENMIHAEIVPGMARTFTLSIDCKENYASVRLQIKPLAGSPGRLKARFRVDGGDADQQWLPAVVDARTDDVRAIYDTFDFVICPTTGFVMAPEAVAPAAKPPLATAVAKLAPTSAEIPAHGTRLLIIDSTPVGRLGSATGQLKSALLAGWPEQQMLQVWEAPGQALRLITLSQTMEQSRKQEIELTELMRRCAEFRPDVVYIRPTESLPLLRFAARLLEENGIPAVVHVMDDWPERLRFADPIAWPEADRLLRTIIARSATRLSIGDAMSREYERRYGGRWSAVANGIDPATYACATAPRTTVTTAAPFVMRYMGGLAEDMNYRSVLEVARAVSSLQGRVPIRLEVHTMAWYKERAIAEMGALPGVQVLDLVPPERYVQTLCGADALLLAYNFDPASIRYISLSLANKMPECLASGVPLFAYGPVEVATIRYLQDIDCAELVPRRDPATLAAAIESLVADAAKRCRLVESSRRHALAKLDLTRIRESFQRILLDAASASSSLLEPDEGDFRRANALFREGHYASAKALYEALYKRRPLEIYQDNSISCGLKMGLSLSDSVIRTSPAPGPARHAGRQSLQIPETIQE